MGTGELYAVVEWIPAAMLLQFAHLLYFVCAFFASCNFRQVGGKRHASQTILTLKTYVFSDLARAPVPLCDHVITDFLN